MEILPTCLFLAGQSCFISCKENGVSFRWKITPDTKLHWNWGGRSRALYFIYKSYCLCCILAFSIAWVVEDFASPNTRTSPQPWSGVHWKSDHILKIPVIWDPMELGISDKNYSQNFFVDGPHHYPYKASFWGQLSVLIGCPSPKPVDCLRVVLCVHEGFPLQVCTDCQAVPMAGERQSCGRWHPTFEIAWR